MKKKTNSIAVFGLGLILLISSLLGTGGAIFGKNIGIILSIVVLALGVIMLYKDNKPE